MKLFRKAALTLLAVLLLSVPALAAETEVTVTDAAGFRAALENEDVRTIRFSRRIVIEALGSGKDALDAGTKTILPADPTTDEDQLIFGQGVTMLHISVHEGNRQNPDTQSVRNIYGRDYDGSGMEIDMGLLMEAAEGYVGWYEYHAADSKDSNGSPDEYAGKRVCYIEYSGSWEDTIETAADLTAEGWKHTPTAGADDENQILFLQFGTPRTDNKEIKIQRDILVTGRTQCFGGQSLTVTNNATLTTAVLGLETAGGDWGYKDAGSSNLLVNGGGKVVLHRWEGEDSREDGAYIPKGGVQLAAEGAIYLVGDDLKDCLTFDKDAEIFCEHHPLAYSPTPIESQEGELRGRPGDWIIQLDGLPGGVPTGWFYNIGFDVDRSTGTAGWRCDPEAAETLLATDADGKATQDLVPCDAGEDGSVRLYPLSAGDYRVYLYHDPAENPDYIEHPEWIPHGVGTDVPGTEGMYLTLSVPDSALLVPSTEIIDKTPDGKTVLRFVRLPGEVVARAKAVFAVSYGPGAAAEQITEGEIEEVYPLEWGASFQADLDGDSRVFLLDEHLRPIVPKMDLSA